jgi:hypothetical protein
MWRRLWLSWLAPFTMRLLPRQISSFFSSEVLEYDLI